MKVYRLKNNNWYVERAVLLIAGIFVLVSIILAMNFSIYFLYFTGFVGFMLMIFSLTGFCPMAIILDKLGLPSKLNSNQ